MRRPLSKALLWSCALHLVVLLAARPWWPAAVRPAPAADAERSVAVTLLPGSPAVDPGGRRPPPVAEDPGHTPYRDAVTPVPPAAMTQEPPVNLNPAPILREEFEIPAATLALHTPMSKAQRDSLHTALNAYAARLPGWTDPARPVRWQDGEQRYQITIERIGAVAPTELERVLLSVSTEVDGLPLTARIPATRMAFSHYAQVVNRWIPGVSLAGDVIIGRFHSNSTLLVDASMRPRVEGPASISGRVNIEGRGDRSEIFSRGLVTRASPVPFPSKPFDMDALATSPGFVHHIDEDAVIRFARDGSYWWRPLAETSPPVRVVPGGDPWVIVGAEGVELQVEGEVRGRVMVYSPTRISIVGHLRYASDPRSGESGDLLGLVSDRYVEVAGPELTGDGDLSVFAAIYAGRQFRVRRYRAHGGGTLSIYGSVTAGSLSASEPRFSTRLEFDPRLESRRSPWFPMTDRYVIDDSALYWTVATRPGN